MLGNTLKAEILRNSSGRVRVAKKKIGSGRVAGTRQSLVTGVGIELLGQPKNIKWQFTYGHRKGVNATTTCFGLKNEHKKLCLETPQT